MDFFDFLQPEGVIRNIRHLVHCPFCGADYKEQDIKLLARFEKNYITHLTCCDCGNSIMASFTYHETQKAQRDTEKKKPDIKSDARINEMMKFVERGLISDDNVLDMYKALAGFDGNFKKLFKSHRVKKKNIS